VATASRAQITRSPAAWTACEGIRAAEQIGGYAGSSTGSCMRLPVSLPTVRAPASPH